MQYFDVKINELAQYICSNNKMIILFGSGAVCKTYVPYILEKYNLVDRVLFIVDNNPTKQGKRVLFGDRFIDILPPSQLSVCKENFCVIITNGDFYPVMKQLDKIDNCNNREGFIAAIMQLEREYNRSEHAVWKDYENPQIPKIIHYCWFSGNPMPKPLQKCGSVEKDDKIFNSKYKLIIWGCGFWGKDLYQDLQLCGIADRVIAFGDNDLSKVGKKINDIPVIDINETFIIQNEVPAIILVKNTYDYEIVRVVSETQCIKDEIFAYMAESARRDCGVPESATVFW